MEVVMTTETIRCAKVQSNQPHQQTNTQLFTGRMHRAGSGVVKIDSFHFLAGYLKRRL